MRTAIPARVVDASVLAAIAFDEPRAAEAQSLLEGADLYAPTLLLYEMASVARKKFLLQPDAGEAIFQDLADALAIRAEWVPVDLVQTLAMALELGLTTYDAAYLYVARALDAPLVTFDERLAAAARTQP